MSGKKTIKSRKFTTKMRKKLLVVFLCIGGCLVILSVVLIKINLSKGEDYSKAVYDNYTYDSRTISARRGDITDRNGTILAYSSKVYNLILDAKILLSDEKYLEPTVAALLQYFPQLDEEELLAYIQENQNKATKSSYKRLLLELTADDIADFELAMEADGSNIGGVWFEEEYQRVYPYGSLAAEVIGFASSANGGELGVEKYYESELAGTDGRTYGYIDSSSYVSETIEAQNGNTVVLTIDYTIQNIVEEVVTNFNETYGSINTTVIAMDPNNGEILALADYPTFDLNNPRDLSDLYTEEELTQMSDEERVDALYETWSNTAVSKIFEPGSVFKPFVVAMALEEGTVTVDDSFLCDGEGVYDGAVIHCHKRDGHGDLMLASVLGQSCNDAMMQIGTNLGASCFSKYMGVYQFGKKTGVDLPSEEQGLLISENEMMQVDLATNSFGQNFNATMMQMASAFASLINGGNYYKPHIVKEIQTASGDTVTSVKAQLVAKTVSENTSFIMRQLLRSVVDYGTAYYAYNAGYSIGGKTGTAEKVGRVNDDYIVSFMGFAPAEDPQILLYVVIDAPEVEQNSDSTYAQILFSEIMQKLLPYYGIMQDAPEYELSFKLYPEDEEYVTKRSYTPATAATQEPEETEQDTQQETEEDVQKESETDVQEETEADSFSE